MRPTPFPMRTGGATFLPPLPGGARGGLLLALAMVGTLAAPAQAETVFTLPGGYRSLVLSGNGTTLDARGAYVPVVWYGGPTRFFKLRFEMGGSYLRDGQGGAYTYGVGQTTANFELPLGPLTPYAGVVGHAAFPFQQPSYVTGIPYGVLGQAGLQLDLGLALIDLHAGTGPVWGLSKPQGSAYEGNLTDVGGRIILAF